MGNERLASLEKAYADTLSPDANAKRQARHLETIREELSFVIKNEELRELFQEHIDQAIKCLRQLDTEVFRLRESIGHYKYGWMSREELIKIPKTWNDSGVDSNL